MELIPFPVPSPQTAGSGLSRNRINKYSIAHNPGESNAFLPEFPLSAASFPDREAFPDPLRRLLRGQVRVVDLHIVFKRQLLALKGIEAVFPSLPLVS